jgi:hypothetical protein
MDVETAIETEIEPHLIDTFGLSVGRCLVTLATLSYVTAGGGETQRYRAFVDSVCSDERVVRKWGAEGVAKQAQEWKDLVPLEPETVVLVGQHLS